MYESEAGRIGRFLWSVDEDEWTWSGSMFELHGLEPGAVNPSRDLLLHHARPDHRLRLAAALSDQFSIECGYTLVAPVGNERPVVLVADQAYDGVVSGYLVDLTGQTDSAADPYIRDREAVPHSQTVIEQAKGIVMLAHGVPSARAFELLAWCSQQHNVKLSALADRLVAQVQVGAVAEPELRMHVDDLLLDCSMSAPPPADPDGVRPTRHSVRVDDGVTTVRLQGFVDLVSASELSSVCRVLLSSARPSGGLTVDLRAVTDIGAAGVSVLCAIRRKCVAAGIELAVLVDPTVPAVVTRLRELPFQAADADAVAPPRSWSDSGPQPDGAPVLERTTSSVGRTS